MWNIQLLIKVNLFWETLIKKYLFLTKPHVPQLSAPLKILLKGKILIEKRLQSSLECLGTFKQ